MKAVRKFVFPSPVDGKVLRWPGCFQCHKAHLTGRSSWWKISWMRMAGLFTAAVLATNREPVCNSISHKLRNERCQEIQITNAYRQQSFPMTRLLQCHKVHLTRRSSWCKISWMRMAELFTAAVLATNREPVWNSISHTLRDESCREI